MEKINELIHLNETDKIYYQTTLDELQNLQQLKKNIKNETNSVFLFYQIENESYQKIVSQLNNDITIIMKKLKKFDQENILLRQHLGRLEEVSNSETLQITNYKRISEIRQTRSLNLIRSSYIFEIQECYNYFEKYQIHIDEKIEEYNKMKNDLIEKIDQFYNEWTRLNIELKTFLDNKVFTNEVYVLLTNRMPSEKNIIDFRDFRNFEKLQIIEVQPNIYYDSFFMSSENNNDEESSSKKRRI